MSIQSRIVQIEDRVHRLYLEREQMEGDLLELALLIDDLEDQLTDLEAKRDL